ncbi:hypothetical protein M404DRAFT_329188 [Pisolithus tinctorius Marx 270]|uniref:Uncharacterized protein n=1 Tax=Pisolithus tinctorius Marx 270 TaxID=870435 RepID=A0A0C3P6H4_PISTI|nr:hypothetical protein M404DRAFT_329188 [Pisolithus tinctorius Marx 270]
MIYRGVLDRFTRTSVSPNVNRPKPRDIPQLDFASDRHADARRVLTHSGLLEARAIAISDRTWTLSKTRPNRTDQSPKKPLARPKRPVTSLKETVEHQWGQGQGSLENARSEERKKHELKFVLVPRAHLLSKWQ